MFLILKLNLFFSSSFRAFRRRIVRKRASCVGSVCNIVIIVCIMIIVCLYIIVVFKFLLK